MELIKDLRLKSGNKVELYKINGTCDKNILIIGTMHGEEPQGFYAIKNYFFNENINDTKNNIYIIPCLNPDGMNKNQRKNGNGVDLNRNYPTKNWELTPFDSEYFGGNAPAGEDETKFVINTIEMIKPYLILTLHSPFAIVNYDGNAGVIAQKISEITKYPVQSDIGYPTPGSFGTYCGVERKIPTITLEYDENEELTSIYEKSDRIFNYLMKEL